MDNQQSNTPDQPLEPVSPAIPPAQPAPLDPTVPLEPATPVSADPPVSAPTASVDDLPAEQSTPVPSDPESTPAPTPIEPAIPVQSPTPVPQPAESTSSAASSSDSAKLKRLLLVEDDDALANVYLMRLQTEGFEVRRVANGEEALAAALNYRPDLIILDAMMPKVSGFDVLDILRNTPETANVKIVMLTALSQDSDKERAESLGVDDYLVKSQVVIADVIDRIRHHLNMQ